MSNDLHYSGYGAMLREETSCIEDVRANHLAFAQMNVDTVHREFLGLAVAADRRQAEHLLRGRDDFGGMRFLWYRTW